MDALGAVVWATIQTEFSDLQNAEQVTRLCVRLLVAIALGAVLGYERELRGTAAGLRTHMLVALGAALFVLVPMQAGMEVADLSRVLQGVVAGIGFLGAGAIIKLQNEEVIKLLTIPNVELNQKSKSISNSSSSPMNSAFIAGDWGLLMVRN